MLNGFGTRGPTPLGTRWGCGMVSHIYHRSSAQSCGGFKQQICDSTSAGRRPDIANSNGHEAMRGKDALMGKLGVVFVRVPWKKNIPKWLGSILGALRSIVTVVGINQMQPPIKDLLPRLTPILRNRHEKVQENTIDLVGRNSGSWSRKASMQENGMRICFELLDMLKSSQEGYSPCSQQYLRFHC